MQSKSAKVYAIAAASLLGYFVMVWLASVALDLKGADVWILRAGLAIIGVIAAVAVLWYYLRAEADSNDSADTAPAASAGAASGASAASIDALLRHADAGLAASNLRGARLHRVPLFLVLGDANSAKTTTLLKSGMELELIAGHAVEGADILPTEPLNCWLARGTVFLEAGAALQADPARWRQLVRRLGKREAPLAAVVCCSVESLLAQNEAASLARRLRAQLEDVAQTAAGRLPTYVIFTKLDSVRTDQIEFFRDFAGRLSDTEAEQALGVALAVPDPAEDGVYAERATQVIAAEFRNLTMGLADLRGELLKRERDVNPEVDARKLAGLYEFPREFGKLQGGVTQFLVELCRPNPLRAGPFLRGFYFCGVRPAGAGGAAMAPAAPVVRDLRATRVARAGDPASRGPQSGQPGGSRFGRAAQWTFLAPVFQQVLLKDRLIANAHTARSHGAGKVALAAVALIAFFLLIATTVSFFGNRALVAGFADATVPPADEGRGRTALATDLAQLDALVETLTELERYDRAGAPWRIRWGLYTGADLYPLAQQAYFERFDRVLLKPVEKDLMASLSNLPVSSAGEGDFKNTFETLRAYLAITSDRDKADPASLPPYLLRRWSDTRRNATDDPLAQILKQFSYYCEQLKAGRTPPREADRKVVGRARAYLGRFGGGERVYQSMLADAGKDILPIRFNQRFPGTAEVLVETVEIPGAFTREGWKIMQEALRNPSRYSSGEQWVLGEDSVSRIDRSSLDTLRDRYTRQYITHWRLFLKGASIVEFRSVADASAKLRGLSGNNSPLLTLLFLASDNTAVDAQEVKKAFQSVQSFVTPGVPDKYLNPSNQTYMNALVQLQLILEPVAETPPETAVDAPLLSQASSSVLAAKTAARQAAQGFAIDPEEHLEKVVAALIEKPVTEADRMLRAVAQSSRDSRPRN